MAEKKLKHGISRYLPDGSTNPEWSKRVYSSFTPEEKKRRNSIHKAWQQRNPGKQAEYQRRYLERNPGAQEHLRECQKVWKRKWKARPENIVRHYMAMKRFHLKRGYGMTLEQYYLMLETQGYKCLLCGQIHEEVSRKRLNVDHCHRTGRVRGLLCSNCNNIIGKADDNIDLLKKAIEYLENNKN